MDAIETIMGRVTVPQARMKPPGPDDDAIATLVAAAAAAPDHGRLRPVRLIVVRGQARARLGLLFAQALQEAEPGASEAELSKQREAPLRTPLIVIVIARLRDNAKVPAVEQIAASAAAAQNLLLAAHALGFAGKWSTGRNAYDPRILSGLGLEPDDKIIGYLYIGSTDERAAPTLRADTASLVLPWPA